MTLEQELAIAKLDAQLERLNRLNANLNMLAIALHQAAIIAQGRQKGVTIPMSAEDITLAADGLADIADMLNLPAADPHPPRIDA